jgi:hypothetical protein
MTRSASVVAFLVVLATAPLMGVADAAALKKVVCTGEFGTGSGTAGSYIGHTCYLDADTDQERQVSRVCKQNSQCEVTAMVREAGNDWKKIERVISVRQVSATPGRQEPYAYRVGNFVDGILAPASAGCDNPSDKSVDRISVLLQRPSGAAIQLFGDYCAVTSGNGDEPSEGGFQATLRATCGNPADSDEKLRTGQSGSKKEIVVKMTSDGTTLIDNEPVTRCKIQKSYTPAWWLRDNPAFNEKPAQ